MKKRKTPVLPRTDDLKSKLITRMNRIEGQVKGVKNMIEEDSYCDDILTQISAIRSALSGVSKLVLEHHIRGCVVEDIKEDDESAVDELLATITRLLK